MPPLDAKQFGSLIRRLREKKRLGLRELARRTGLSPALLSRGEKGARDLRDLRYIVLLAKALELDPEWLRVQAGAPEVNVVFSWVATRSHALDMLMAKLEDDRRLHFYRAAGWALLALADDIAVAWADGELDEAGMRRLDEWLKAAVAIVERRHPDGLASALLEVLPKEGQETAYVMADAIIEKLYDLHRDEIDRLLARGFTLKRLGEETKAEEPKGTEPRS